MARGAVAMAAPMAAAPASLVRRTLATAYRHAVPQQPRRGRQFSSAATGRSLGLRGLPTFHMEKLSGWNQAQHQLAASDCEPLAMAELLAMADDECRAKWDSLNLGYPPTRGDEQLLAEITGGLYAGSSLSVEHVLGVVPAEGILLAMHALLSPGDHVVVVGPCYGSLRSVAQSALGCSISTWDAEWLADGRPTFCVDKLRQLASRPGTKLLVANFPHNPTGFLPAPDEWAEVVRICDERGIYLFSDEMYRHLESSHHAPLPSAAECYSRGVSLSGLSKAYGLPGLRVGWLASPDRDVINRCYELKDYTTICSSSPSECLALIALRNREALWKRCTGIIARNIQLMDEFVMQNGRERIIEWRAPMAGPVALPRLLAGGAAQHCASALRDEGVMLIPDREFGTVADRASGTWADDRLRIGLGRKGFDTMLQAWGRALDRCA